MKNKKLYIFFYLILKKIKEKILILLFSIKLVSKKCKYFYLQI